MSGTNNISRLVRKLGLFCLLALLLCSAPAARASEYHGLVTFGGQPVPGATVTATQGTKKVTVLSGPSGYYSFPDLPDGKWTITIEMLGFTPVTQEVVIPPPSPGAWDLKLMTLDQIQTQMKPLVAAAVNAPATPAVTAPAKSSAASQQNGAPQPPPPPPPPPDDAQQQRAADGLLINGSVNNAATSQFSQNARFGNGVNNGRFLYNGGFSLVVDNSALDANNYSLTGAATPKPEQNLITAGFNIGGPFRLPHLMRNSPPYVYLAYQRTWSSVGTTNSYIVPAAGLVATSPQAQDLLSLYPAPNVTGGSVYNYQTALVSDMHQDGLQFRVQKGLGNRNNLAGDFALQTTRNSNPTIFHFPGPDKTDVLGLNTGINWLHRFGPTFFVPNLTMTLGYRLSRLRTDMQSAYDNKQNLSGAYGITGNNSNLDPMDWGPPSLAFTTSGITSLTDGQSLYNRVETNAGTLILQWSHGRHFITGGGDFTRKEYNYLQQSSNARGAFTFTGAATGSTDLADFLAGIPDASAIVTGNPDKYFRENIYDAYATDDWRVRPELTINAGVRWQYSAPITELKQRLVNLDIAPGFTQAEPVLASSPTGPLTGQIYPQSLVRPDRRDVGPNISLSWRPIPGSSLLVRSSYAINFDSPTYQAMALQMAQQAPLSESINVQNSSACPLTLANGFKNCSTSSADTFAVDPNYRVGYVQTWFLSVQRDLPMALQMTATYLGIKGTRSQQAFLPNTYPEGGTNPCPSCPIGFEYFTSGGDSTRESGSLLVRRRLRSGFLASALYTFSKSLDDASVLGGSGPMTGGANSATAVNSSIAQNWLNLHAERSLSSFDQRNLVTATLQYTSGIGLGGRALMGGWVGRIYRDWTFLTNISAGSGTPETPSLAGGLIPQTSYGGVIRANSTGAPIYAGTGGLFLNPAAFAAPAAGQWGDARRNSIIGPQQFSMSGAMQRTFRVKQRYYIDAQITANNVLNHVTYTGWQTAVGSQSFGAPQSANAMRKVQTQLRVRF